MHRFLSTVCSLFFLASLLATALPTAASAQTGPTPTDVQSFSATASGSTVSLAAQIAFGGQAPVVLGTDPTGDAPPNGTGHGAGLGLDLTALRAYRPTPDGPVSLEWQTTSLDRLPPPETVRYYWQFLVNGNAPFAAQAKTTDVVSAANLGDGEPGTIVDNLSSYTSQSVPTFRLRGNCGFIGAGGVNALSNCGHVAWVTGEFDFTNDVVRFYLPVNLADAAVIRPGATLAPDTNGGYAAFQLAADLGQTRDTVVQESAYVIPDSVANVSLVNSLGAVVSSGQLTAAQDGTWSGNLTAPAPGTYTVNLSACFANNCDTATSTVVIA
jgi:hypothetical protein